MNWLRIYISAVDLYSRNASSVFYSRRANGPFYRWQYDLEAGEWRFSRMHTFDLTPQQLCVARWKSVPLALQTRLTEHYLE